MPELTYDGIVKARKILEDLGYDVGRGIRGGRDKE